MDYTFWNRRRPVPNYEDDVIAALEHPDRVRGIKLAVTSSLLEVVASVMQEPFLALTTLWLASNDRNAPVLPDVFLSGSAPNLQQIYLAGISFPALPTLLLSASELVDLQLEDIPRGGYISPEAMVTSLAALTRLESLCIWFKSPTSPLELICSPLSTQNVLPSLVTFNFCGSSEYLEHLLAGIETPRLRSFTTTYFNQLDFQVPQLSQFIRRTDNLELARSRHEQVRFRISNAYIELNFEEKGHRRSRLTFCISCKLLDWQISHLAQILGQSPAMVSNVDHLSIGGVDPGWKDDIDDTDWLELLRPFTAVKMLRGSRQLAGHIARALDGISGEMVTEVLPALDSLLLEDQSGRSVERFIAVRQLSGHPVIFTRITQIQSNGRGLSKAYHLSEPLAAVVQEESLSRPQVVKQLWQYIKSNKLQNPLNGREILCDSALKAVFNTERIDMFNMNKELGKHLSEPWETTA